jgi:hypothetical protein
MQMSGNNAWARQEVGNVALGDPRRTARLIKLCGRLSEMPESGRKQDLKGRCMVIRVTENIATFPA